MEHKELITIINEEKVEMLKNVFMADIFLKAEISLSFGIYIL